MSVEAPELIKPVETSPGFSINYAIEKCRTLSRENALTTLSGDFKFQAYEGAKLPLSDPFYYEIKGKKGEERKVIFECDTETQTDIVDVTSDKTRNGKEKPTVAAWRNLLIEENDKIAELPKDQRKPKTIFQINPAQDKDDPTDHCYYQMAQANIVILDGSNKAKVFQLQFEGNIEECARLFKMVTKSKDFYPQRIKNVDQMMMSFGVIEDIVKEDELLTSTSFVTHKKLPTAAEIATQRQEILDKSRIAALTFYNNVELGLSQTELEKLYSRLLGRVLPETFVRKLRKTAPASGGGVGFAMETSCGLVMFGESTIPSVLSSRVVTFEKWTYTKGDCIRNDCKKKDVEVGPCKFCKDCEKKLA